MAEGDASGGYRQTAGTLGGLPRPPLPSPNCGRKREIERGEGKKRRERKLAERLEGL